MRFTAIPLLLVSEFQRKVLQSLEELKSAVANNTRQLQMMQQSSGSSLDLPELPETMQLPISSTREMEVIEDMIKDDETILKTLVCTIYFLFQNLFIFYESFCLSEDN